MAVSNYTCAVIGCGNKLSDHARSDICPRCQGVSRYWQHPDRGATPSERLGKILARQASLKLWSNRMNYLGKTVEDYGKLKRVFKPTH